MGLAARRVRAQLADGPYDQALAPYDLRSTAASAGRAYENVLARDAAACAERPRQHISATIHTPSNTNRDKTGPLFDRLHVDSCCVAPACAVYALRPLRDLAHGRTNNVSWRRSPVLVACYPALANSVD